MLGRGKPTLADFLGVLPYGLAHRFLQACILFYKTRPDLAGDAEHVMQNQHLPVALRPRSDSDGRD